MKYILILIIAILIGAGCALPNILGYLEFKENYEPFSHLFSSDIQFDETTFYSPAASYFKENLSLPFEVDIYEYRNTPNLRYILPSIIEGSIAYLLNNLRLAWGFIHFIFPLTSFLFIYILARKLTNYPLIACFSAVIFCTLGFGPRNFLNLYSENLFRPVFFSRISSPAVTLPFLIICLTGLVKIQERRLRIGIILSGIFGGLLFYTYYFYVLVYAFTLISLFFIYVFKKDLLRFCSILFTGIISFIVAIPWFIQYFYTLKLSPAFISFWSSGLYNPSITETLSGLTIFLLLILSCLLLSTCKVDNKNCFNNFLDSKYLPIFLVIIISLFLQFIMSRFIFGLLQPSHFLQQIANGFTLLIISSILGNKLTSASLLFRIPILISILLLIIFLFVKQASVWANTNIYFYKDPLESIGEGLIYKHTNRQDVIGLCDPYLNSVIPARIWRFRFYVGYFGQSNIPSQENLQRYLFIQKIFNHPWEDVDKKLSAMETIGLIPLESITIPYLLTLQRSFSQNTRLELSRLYNLLNKDFVSDKKLDYLLCLNTEEEKEVFLGAKKLEIKLFLVEKKLGVSLYKLIRNER